MVPQGSKDLAKVLVCAPYTGVFADCRGHDVQNLKKDCSIAHDGYRTSSRTTVLRDPKLLKGNEDGLWRGRWVAAQKPSQQHLAGETSLLFKTIRSPTTVARLPCRKRLQECRHIPDSTAGFVTTARTQTHTNTHKHTHKHTQTHTNTHTHTHTHKHTTQVELGLAKVGLAKVGFGQSRPYH